MSLVTILELAGAAFVVLMGLGLAREAVREVFISRRRLRSLPRLPGRVVWHVRESRVLRGAGGSDGRVRSKRHTFHFPVVEVEAPDGRRAHRRMGFGHSDPNRYPVGSTIEVLWDPDAGAIVEKPGLGHAALVAGTFVFGALVMAGGAVWGAWTLGRR